MRFDRQILSIGLLIAVLAWTLWFVFAGFGNHQDPLYWLYKYEQMEGGWMAVGTLLTGGAIVRLFGAQLLPLRLVGWLCTVTAVALPYCCLMDKEQRRTSIHWLALAFLLMGYGAFQEFSPGTLTVLLLSILWVLTVKDLDSNCLSVAAAVVAGVAVAVRFPNILALLILIPLWRKRSLWNIPIVLLSAGIVYLLGWLCITPAATDAAMSSHNIGSMLTKLWEKGGLLIGFGLMAVGVLAVGKKGSSLKNPLPLLLSLLVGLVLVYYIAFVIKPVQWYNIDLTYMVSAFCLVLALATGRKELYIGAALTVVASLGTDTAWLKLFPAVLCLLPVAAVQHEAEMRRFLWPALAVMAIAVAVRFTTNSVGKTNLMEARTSAVVAPYTHIAIRETEQQWLMQVKADVDSLGGGLALGQEMHLMRAVTGCEAGKYNEFWSNIFDSVYTAKYRTVIQEQRPVVFCSFSPQFKTKPIYRDGESRLERMLLEEGYQPLDRKRFKYMIYIPNND